MRYEAMMLCLWLAGTAAIAASEGRNTHWIDHVVVGIHDLEQGIADLEDLTGVRAERGGRHPHLGTHNALIALGPHSYLEIIAPDPDADLEGVDPWMKSQFRDPLEEMQSLTPFLWAVGSDDLDLTSRLMYHGGVEVSPPAPGSRRKSWFKRLKWESSHVVSPEAPALPFFIRWDDKTTPPPEDAPKGCLLTRLDVNTRNFRTVQGAVAALQVDAQVVGSEVNSLAVTMECPKGEVTL